MLKVNQLTKTFGDRLAVNGVSFSLKQGQTLGLIGPNGAGKSTTVSMICGLLRPDSGDVQLDGIAIGQGRSAAKHKIGLVPQDLALFDDLSARENLKIFGALYGLRGTALKSRCDDVLALVNLADRAADLTSTFSGGMKRRLNIAAALLHNPPLLILDEPTVGVDPQSRNAIFDSLELLKKQGHALIYTSHYMEEVERLADQIVVIDHGKVIADESPSALYLRLPATAALHLDLAQALSHEILLMLKTRSGVVDAVVRSQPSARSDAAAPAKTVGQQLHIALRHTDDALPVLDWLAAQGCRPLYFATAKASLEEIFLTLTGRTLRD